MKTTVLADLSVCACVTGSLLVLPVERSLAQSTGTSNTTLPVVTIRAVDPEAAEPGSNTGMFHLLRDGTTNLALNVFVQISGTASNGVDYGAIPNWIPIPAGVRTVPILVRPIDDNLSEGTETVEARLIYPPIMAPITYQIGSPSNAVVSIYDNDPAPTNRPPWVSIVTPTNGAAFPAPVDIAIAAHAVDPDVGDYVATVEFFAGTTFLGVRTNNPISGSPVNPFMLVWSNAPPGHHRLTARATDTRGAKTVSAPVEILVYVPPPLVTVRATDPNAAESGLLTVIDSGEFTISRSYGTNVPLTVYFSITGTASNGVDYLWISNCAVIPAGQLCTRVMVYPRPDNLREPTETVVLRILPPACAAVFPPTYECYQPGIPREAVVFIADSAPPGNLPPVVTISAPDAVASEGTNCVRWAGWSCCPPPTNWCGTNTATFVVRRSGPTNDALRVCYRINGTASNGVDYVELPGVVAIPAGRRAGEIKVVPIDDLLPERLETVVLRLCVPPDSSVNVPPYLIGYPGRAAALIVDNDAPRPVTSLLSDRCFHIMRPSANGTCWRIECSSNLVDWTAICTTTVTDGAIHFVDPDADDAMQRYYRAVPQPNPPAE